MTSARVIDITELIDRAPIGSLQLTVVVLCALVMLLDGLNTQVIGYLGPALAKEWHLSRAVLAPVFSSGLAGLMAGLLLTGPFSDRMGRRVPMIVSVLLFGVFTILSANAQGVTSLIVYRVLAGIGLGGALPNALALTGEYSPQRTRATYVVVMFCGFSLGSILGGGLTATLITRYGWRSVFLIGGIGSLMLLPLLAALLPESPFIMARKDGASEHLERVARCIAPHTTFPPGTRFMVQSQPAAGVAVTELFAEGRAAGTILLWIVFFMNLWEFYFLQSWLPLTYTSWGISTETSAWLTTLISVGGIVAGVLSGPLVDRFGPYWVLGTLYASGTVAVAAIGVASSSLFALIAATFCAGLFVSGGQKTVNAAAVLYYPTNIRSTGVGWALGIGRAGGIIGPLAGGWLLAQGWSRTKIFGAAAIPLLCACVVILTMGLRRSVPMRAANAVAATQPH